MCSQLPFTTESNLLMATHLSRAATKLQDGRLFPNTIGAASQHRSLTLCALHNTTAHASLAISIPETLSPCLWTDYQERKHRILYILPNTRPFSVYMRILS
jgi:hypothetical protein